MVDLQVSLEGVIGEAEGLRKMALTCEEKAWEQKGRLQQTL